MINENLKQICLKRGISAYRLSKLANIPISVVAKIIRGEVKNPRIDSVIKIVDALDVTLDELVGRSEGWNLTQGICIAGAWMIANHNEEAMVVDMLASMHITKELMQQEHIAEEDYEILSEAIDSNWGRYVRQLPENI